jgi:hypothetical protein
MSIAAGPMSDLQTSTIEPVPTSRFRAYARQRYGGAVANGDFRWLWLLSLFSSGGDAIATVAMPLLVYDLTDSAGLLGIMFSLLVGHPARRIRRGDPLHRSRLADCNSGDAQRRHLNPRPAMRARRVTGTPFRE